MLKWLGNVTFQDRLDKFTMNILRDGKCTEMDAVKGVTESFAKSLFTFMDPIQLAFPQLTPFTKAFKESKHNNREMQKLARAVYKQKKEEREKGVQRSRKDFWDF